MKLVNIFMKDPCIGWFPVSRFEFNGHYTCTDEFAEDICFIKKCKLFKKEVELIGESYIVHLTLQSIYSIEHPESNQAHFYAEAVLVNE